MNAPSSPCLMTCFPGNAITRSAAVLEQMLTMLVGRRVEISEGARGFRDLTLPVVGTRAMLVDHKTARRAIPILALRWQRKAEARAR